MFSLKFIRFISVGVLVFLSTGMLYAQTNVSGVVTDNFGNPIAGVTVMIPGTMIGTSTTTQGAYVLNAGDSEYLEYTCLGYKTVKIKIDGRSSIDVTLEEDRTGLDEIVVVGYGVQKRRDIVGAIETINTEEVSERFGSSMGIARSLQGVIPGLTLSFTDGKPTRNATVQIRGVENSIGAGGSALILLDGIEVEMDHVNPEDIASVTVLKDASSTAVYGARGTFGVILLTSKTPQTGRTRITYDGTFNMYQRTTKFESVTNGYEWTTNFLESYINAQGSDPSNFNSKYTFSRDWYEEFGRRNSDPTASKYRIGSNGEYEYFGNTNWWDLFYKKLWTGHQHTITASGGSDIANFYVSGRIFSQDGMYKVGDEKWNQYNIMAKSSVNIKPWLHVTETVDFFYRKTREDDGRYEQNDTIKYPTARVLATECFPFAVPYNEDGTWTLTGVYGGYAHMVDGTEYRLDYDTEFSSKTAVRLDIIKDVLWASADFGIKYKNSDQLIVFGADTYYTAPDVAVVYPTTTTMTENTSSTQNITANATLNYVPRLGDNHYLAFLVGWNLENTKYKATSLYRTDMMTTTPNWNLMDGDNLTISDGGSYDWGSVGAFFRVNYGYKSKYLIEASGRYDGISKFPTSQRWGFFPSGSVGWRISEEGFMKNADWLDNLKIRFSVGSAGNGLISDAYAYLSMLTLEQSSVLSNGSTFKYASSPNPVPDGLTWESALTYDLGIDFEALDGRLNFVGDIYRKNTVNMYVVGEELPAVYGNDAPKGNYADMRTDGYELSLSWRDSYVVGGKSLSYYIRGAFWDNTSKITRYTSKTGTLPTTYSPAYYEGMTLGEIWGYVCNGLYQSDEDAANYDLSFFNFRSCVYQAGDPKFEDLNGDGIINNGSNTISDHGDLVKIGNTSPRYQYSLQAGISWNGIGLSMMWQGVGKRDWYPSKESDYFWGQYCRPYDFYFPWHADRWSDENRDAYWPRLVGYNASGGNLIHANTRYMQNARYIRLKNLTIDYSFPNRIVSKIGLQALKVYFNMENPFTFSPLHKYAKNYDPEGLYPGDADYAINNYGEGGYGDGEGYPVLKSYTIGLSITL